MAWGSRQGTLLAFGVLLAFLSMAPAASSRNWTKTPVSRAQDYTFIRDDRGNGDVVMLTWAASPAVSTSEATKPEKELLDRYVVLGVVHAHFAKDGAATFDKVDTLEARSGDGHPLKALGTDTIPAAVAGKLAILESDFGRSAGPIGQDTKWFVFNSGDLRACGHGRLSVAFANEIYTYDTPIPGCPKRHK